MYIYNIIIISQHVLDSISKCIKISRFLCHQQYDHNLTINIVFGQFDVQNIFYKIWFKKSYVSDTKKVKKVETLLQNIYSTTQYIFPKSKFLSKI